MTTWRSAKSGIKHAFRGHLRISLCGHIAWRDTRTSDVGDLTCEACARLAREAAA